MFSYKFYLLWSPSDNCNSLWHISDTGWTVSACKLLSYSIVKKKFLWLSKMYLCFGPRLFPYRWFLLTLWDVCHLQIWVILLKICSYQIIHHLSDFQLMKFLASRPTARQCLGKEMEEREGGICRALQNGTLWSPWAGPGLFEAASLEGWVSLKQWVIRVFCSLMWMLLRNRGASSRSQVFSFIFSLLFFSSPTL